MEISMASIGERIKMRRLALHLTQTDIFEKCGISSGVLSRIENGKNVPSVIAFHKLAQVLECDMNWLATGESVNIQNGILCKNEEKLLSGFRELSEDEQEELIGILILKLRKGKGAKDVAQRSSTSIETETGNMVG